MIDLSPANHNDYLRFKREVNDTQPMHRKRRTFFSLGSSGSDFNNNKFAFLRLFSSRLFRWYCVTIQCSLYTRAEEDNLFNFASGYKWLKLYFPFFSLSCRMFFFFDKRLPDNRVDERCVWLVETEYYVREPNMWMICPLWIVKLFCQSQWRHRKDQHVMHIMMCECVEGSEFISYEE